MQITIQVTDGKKAKVVDKIVRSGLFFMIRNWLQEYHPYDYVSFSNYYPILNGNWLIGMRAGRHGLTDFWVHNASTINVAEIPTETLVKIVNDLFLNDGNGS